MKKCKWQILTGKGIWVDAPTDDDMSKLYHLTPYAYNSSNIFVTNDFGLFLIVRKL